MNFEYPILIKFSRFIQKFYDYRNEELMALQIPISHIRILHYLMDHELLSQQQLSKNWGLSKSTVSETLSAMEKNDLIIKENKFDDKRVSIIKLSKKGKEIGLQIQNQYISFCDSCLSTFTEAEVTQFQEAINRFIGDSPVED